MLESSLIALSLQIIVALAILNVWFLRSSKQTKFRGSDARTLSEEFENKLDNEIKALENKLQVKINDHGLELLGSCKACLKD